MKRIIREATPTDVTEIMKVMEAAKGIMRQSGNMHQWTDGYPSEAVILGVIEQHGFTYCGIIHIASDDEWLAYQHKSSYCKYESRE